MKFKDITYTGYQYWIWVLLGGLMKHLDIQTKEDLAGSMLLFLKELLHQISGQ